MLAASFKGQHFGLYQREFVGLTGLIGGPQPQVST